MMERGIIKSLPKEYGRELRKEQVKPDPVEQFACWFEEAASAGCIEPHRMILATASGAGQPSVRVVLLKNFDEQGFVFFTNYSSRKGREIDENPGVALLFYWPEMHRQVRIEGHAGKINHQESARYFLDRPFKSQVGAWASRQSELIESRQVLEKSFSKLLAEMKLTGVNAPSFWGGYRVRPERVEFWQGRENRLHDRLLYSRQGKCWRIVRLSP